MLIRKNISLKPFNTFGIRQKAKLFCTLESAEDINNLLASELFKKNNHLFLGGGSNVLFTQDFPGIVIKNDIKGIEMVKEDRNHVWIKAMSGENWHEFVLHCITNKWAGIENLMKGCLMKRLIVMRHAKTEDWAEGIDDHGRALTERGRLDAANVGREIIAKDWTPDFVAVSSARRAKETWNYAQALHSIPHKCHSL